MTIREQEDVRLFKPLEEIWKDAQDLLSKRLKHPTYESFFRLAKLTGLQNGEAVVGVCNEFMRGGVLNHAAVLTEVLCQVLQDQVSVKVVVDQTATRSSYSPTLGSIAAPPNTPSPVQSELSSTRPLPGNSIPNQQAAISRASLNSKYTFDTFVVGSNNRFSHSAAQAVSRAPGQTYNPLFLYGGVGLGKTHIMQAIGQEVLSHSPHLTVRYLTCEQFTNEVINSIRDDKMLDFRKRYRLVDVLLVDDIQFIQGKESTQEEFFHTFNSLREAGRQIVLSSDRPPKEISRLEERLRSRFEWGLIADIQAPDFETRLAILQKKCALEGMDLTFEVLDYIASTFSNNIRELEGALIRAQAYVRLTGTPLNLETIGDVLQPGKQKQQKQTLSIDRIIDLVCSRYRVEPSELRSAKRSQDLALPRHITMYLAHNLMNMSFPRIGDAFNRKHTSALYAYKTIKETMAQDADLADVIKQLKHQLGV